MHDRDGPSAKGRDQLGWFLLVAFAALVATLAVIVLRSTRSHDGTDAGQHRSVAAIEAGAPGGGEAGDQRDAAAEEKRTAGLKITGTDGERRVRVLVDGMDKGTLPVHIRDLAPGTRVVRLDGGERYASLERTVDITAGETLDLGEIRLRVLKGRIHLDIVTAGVAVRLVRRGDAKVHREVPEPERPFDVDPSDLWRLVAGKPGFDDFIQDLVFDDGQAERNIRIELVAAAATAKVSAPGRSPIVDTPPPATVPGPPAAAALSFVSIPVSKVILDGKPIGNTPMTGVSVPPGTHTVVFLHGETGNKKSVTVQVRAGDTKTVGVKLE